MLRPRNFSCLEISYFKRLSFPFTLYQTLRFLLFSLPRRLHVFLEPRAGPHSSTRACYRHSLLMPTLYLHPILNLCNLMSQTLLMPTLFLHQILNRFTMTTKHPSYLCIYQCRMAYPNTSLVMWTSFMGGHLFTISKRPN